MKRSWGVLVLAALLVPLAGCSDGAPGGGTIIVPPSTEDVDVTPTTGAIRGIVIDETITPVQGAVITVTGVTDTVKSADDGGFVFNGLAAGNYFVSASKFGFQTIQTSVDVVAGRADPDLLRISLPRLTNATAPYANTQQWSGFTQCAVSVVAAFAQACGQLDDRFINYFAIDRIPDYMQAEMHWTSTQAVTPKLQLNFYQGGTTDWKSVAGVSPLLINATGAEFIEAKGEDATDNPMRVSPPYIQCSGGITNPTSCDPQTVAIVNVNQAYEVFLTQFYGFLPREGWLFAVDGPCSTYDQCGA